MKKQDIKITISSKHSSCKGEEYLSADTVIHVFATRTSLFRSLESFERKLKKIYPIEEAENE